MVTNYMRARLQLLAEGGVLVGTPEEYVERHERAYADRFLERRRCAHINIGKDFPLDCACYQGIPAEDRRACAWAKFHGLEETGYPFKPGARDASEPDFLNIEE